MKVVTSREIMLYLVLEGYYRLVQTESFGATCGDGKANVAVSLANFGTDISSVTKLPKYGTGQGAVNSLRRYDVDVPKITRGGDRVGICFLGKGVSQRPPKVIYGCAGSAVATTQPSDFNWDDIFEGVSWFHFTGTTPAINDNAAVIRLGACRAAERHNVTVSCGPNCRKNLWSREKAGQVMGGLMEYVNVCISNEEDASDMLGIKAANTDTTGSKISHEGYREVTKKLADTSHFDKIVITLCGSISASDNNQAAMLYDDSDYYLGKNYLIRIVDRVDGGDSFDGGLIYSLFNSYAPQGATGFAVAASHLKHPIEGDFNQASVDEVNKLAKGDGSGCVQR